MSNRNPLLNRKIAKMLEVKNVQPEEVLHRLYDEEEDWFIWLPPESLQVNIPLQETCEIQNELDFSENDKMSDFPETLSGYLFFGNDRKNILTRLATFYRDSHLAFEERGIQILRAGFGLVVRTDPSGQEFESPLIISPLEIDRKRCNDGYLYSIKLSDDDVVINPALRIEFNRQFKQELPEFSIEQLDKVGAIAYLSAYFTQIEMTIETVGWQFKRTTVIGKMQFANLSIYEDLTTNASAIKESPIIQAIATKQIDKWLQVEINPDKLNTEIARTPEKVFQVLDADSSQQAAIEAARAGQSFVLQGPPGTGKSQTITNLIAEFLADGKRVLLVSDKMAALDVVYKRLQQETVSLQDLCLELHSAKANKKAVLKELQRCYEQNPTEFTDNMSGNAYIELLMIRQNLTKYVRALHAPQQPDNRSAHWYLSRLATLENIPAIETGFPSPKNDCSATFKFLFEHEDEIFLSLTKLSAFWTSIVVENVPWMGLRYDETDKQGALKQKISIGIELLEQIIQELHCLSDMVGLEVRENYDNAVRFIEQLNWVTESPILENVWFELPSLEELLTELRENERRQGIYLKIKNETDAMFYPLIYQQAPAQIEQIKLKCEKIIGDFSDWINNVNAEMLFQNCENMKVFAESTNCLYSVLNDPAIQSIVEIIDKKANLSAQNIASIVEVAETFAERKLPRFEWFEWSVLEAVKHLIAEVEKQTEEAHALKMELMQRYTEEFLGWDFHELLERKDGFFFTSPFRHFYPEYKKMMRDIRKVTLDHHAPESEELDSDLRKGNKYQQLLKYLKAQEALCKELLGPFFQDVNTNYQEIHRLISMVERALKLIEMRPDNCIRVRDLLENRSWHGNLGVSVEKLKLAMGQWQEVAEKLSFIRLKNVTPLNHVPFEILTNWVNRWKEPLSDYDSRIQMIRGCLKPGNQLASWVLTEQSLVNACDVTCFEEQEVANAEEYRNKFGRYYDGIERTDWQSTRKALEWAGRIRTEFDARISLQFIRRLCDKSLPVEQILKVEQRLSHIKKGFLDEFYDLFERLPDNHSGLRWSEKPIRTHLEFLQCCRDNIEGLGQYRRFSEIIQRMGILGLSEYVTRIIDNKVSANQIESCFKKQYYTWRFLQIAADNPVLGEFVAQQHEEMIAKFQDLDRQIIKVTADRIKKLHWGRAPIAYGGQRKNAQEKILKYQSSKQKGLWPVRKLFEQIPSLLLALKPCLLMSPLSISTYLPSSNLIQFDLVIFDEASQVRTEEGIVAMYRGKQVIVCGDSDQMPPTNFFASVQQDGISQDDEEDDQFGSILDECKAISFPERLLNWHYRSRHQDLIAFSNSEIYGNRLVVFPACEREAENLGVEFVYVPNGVYARGISQTNIIEAQKVVERIFQHFDEYGEARTLGVIAFSVNQSHCIKDELERHLKDPIIAAKYDKYLQNDRLNGFFVKNLENVQGDERDVIFLSVCYAKDAAGVFHQQFGPLSKEGGYRRLNVAITRARYKMVVVSSIRAADIALIGCDSASSDPLKGGRLLYKYLSYAENGINSLAIKNPGGGTFENIFEEAVIETIKKWQYEVVPQVGVSLYRIDIGILDPQDKSRFLIGIECDGKTYHSGENARTRDRLRQDILEGLGWDFHRVWSTEWFYDNKNATQKLLAAIKASEEKAARKREHRALAKRVVVPPEVKIVEVDIVADVQVLIPEGKTKIYKTPVNELPAEEAKLMVPEARNIGSEKLDIKLDKPKIPKINYVPEQTDLPLSQDDANKELLVMPLTLLMYRSPCRYLPCEAIGKKFLTDNPKIENYYSDLMNGHCSPENVPSPILDEMILYIIKNEHPVHAELLSKRVVNLFGRQRLTKELSEIIDSSLTRMEKKRTILKKDSFIYRPKLNVRPRTFNPSKKANQRDRRQVSNDEHAAIIMHFVDKDNHTVESLTREICEQMNYDTRGAGIIHSKHLESIIMAMLQQGCIKASNEGILRIAGRTAYS